MYGYIYKTTNLVNGKIYIGQHKANKFEPNKYIGSGHSLKKAIKKYGIKNFKNELLCECFSQIELDEKEIHYINKYNSTDRQIGYNITIGGNGIALSADNLAKLKQKNHNRLINTTIMHKNNKEVAAKEDEINYYLSIGYLIGRSNKAKENLSKNYNYDSKGMLGKKQTATQKAAVSKACSYKRTAAQRKNFSKAKKIPNKFICLRTPDNKSTIRCLIKNKDYYINQGYHLCKNKNK